MSAKVLHLTPAPETLARIALVRAMSELGGIVAQLPRTETLLAGAIEMSNLVYEADKDDFCALPDDNFQRAVYGEEWPRIVLALQQLEVGVSHLYDAAGRIGQMLSKCAAMPDDGTDATLRGLGLLGPKEYGS